MSTKKDTPKKYTVMHDKGEFVDGKNIRPYESFRSVPTPELESKVKKGFLLEEETRSKSSSKRRARR